MRYILRSLIFLHRWVGVALCLVFLLWFPSGIGMMYWTFPGVSAEDRLNHSPRLDPAKITLSPAEAAEKAGVQPNPAQIRLNSFDGRPVYRITGGGGGRGGGGRGGGGGRIIYADTGEEQTEVSTEMVDRIASSWAGKPFAEAKKETIEEVDQWTVAGNFRNISPLYKYTWPDGQQVYLNGRTGEIVQYTTSFSRFAAHISAIPHWLYYTPLRKHQPQWLSFMIWSSIIGTGGAIVGMIIAVWMYSPKRRYRLAGQPTGVPYRGQKRWHWILGMVFGVATVTWTFSGLLSLGPFPLVQRLTQTASQRAQQQQAEQSSTEEQPQQQAAVEAPRGNGSGAPDAQRQTRQAEQSSSEVPQQQTATAAVDSVAAPRGENRTSGRREAPSVGEGAQMESGQQVQAGQRRGGRGRGGFGRGGRRGGDGAENRDGAETTATAANAQTTPGNTPDAQANQARGTAGNRGQVASNQGGQNASAGNANNRSGGGGRGGGPQGPAGALRGRVRWADFAAVHPRELLAKNPQLDVRELDFTSFDSTPLVNVNLSEGKSQLLFLDGTPIYGFDPQKVIDLVKNALPDPKAAEVKMVEQYDLYYFDRLRKRPLPVILILTNDADRTRYYVDPKTARILTTYSDRNWVNRWLYTGLHSLNFPFLYNYRPLWDIVVITFMLGGTALCVTSLVLAWRTLGRKLKRVAVNDVLPREG